ncbi:MAG: hypothetical protein M1835_006653 [Candelina submexicana]|nr:MAG: hypothetical protein M1835_006653 [Candelina submexicana]
MPASRRSSTKASGPAARGSQSTISFGARSKVTKPSIPTHSKKQDASLLKEVKAVSSAPEPESLTTAEVALADQVQQEVQRPKTKAEEDGERVTDAQIKRYWKAKEDERKAPRVHQEGVSMNEKILRHFDLSSQYGPCIGIARMKRWYRANNLNLHPPIEVLAVLIKEESIGSLVSQRAHVDELLSSRLSSDAKPT